MIPETSQSPSARREYAEALFGNIGYGSGVWWYGKSMATSKVTFTLDDATVNRLQQASARLAMPKSKIIREAILEFYDRIGRLSEHERIGMLRAFDELVPKIPVRSATEVDRELAEVRKARKMGGRRTAARNR